MASLEELLAKDGFKRVKPKSAMIKVPNASRAMSMPLPRCRDANLPSASAEHRINGEGMNRWRKSLPSSPAIGYEDTHKIPASGGGHSNARAYGTQVTDGSRSGDAGNLQEKQRHKQVANKGLVEEEWGERKHMKDHIPKRTSSKGGHLRDLRPSEGSRLPPSERSRDLQSRGQLNLKGAAGMEPPLDEAATQALISVPNDYIRCFFKDRDFRMFLRQKCYYCLRFTGKQETNQEDDGGVVAKLMYAIGIIERSAEEFPDPTDLKRSCVQLGIIAGLNSSGDLNGGLTSAIPNSRLSACAHLYLSLICRMQKRDRASAKHLLQVFCDSPFEARTILLPGLWERLLLPHLSHLEEWHVKEEEDASDTPYRHREMKLLERVYSDALDGGTRQIAAYYKEWLMEGTEAPEYPSIHVPSASFFKNSQEGPQVVVSSLRSPSNSVSSQPLMSRKLYESIFNRSREKDISNELAGGEERHSKQSCACTSSSSGRYAEDDEMGNHHSSPPTMNREEQATNARSAGPVREDVIEYGIAGDEL